MIYIIGNDGTPQRVDGVGNELYPVGSIYMSTENTSPASMFGGTWEQILGKFLLSSDDVLTNGIITTVGSYHVNDSGGEATHTLTVNEMPRHSHSTWMSDGTETNPPLQDRIPLFAWSKHGQISLDTASSGGGQAHNNMPPYLVVYCWKRIS